MKHIFKPALGLAGGLLLSSVASAGLITDTVSQNAYLGLWESHSYSHNINDDGFSLGSAISGTLEIDIYDDNIGTTIPGGCLGRFCLPDINLPDGFETVLFTIETFDLDTGDITFGDFDGNLEVNALAALNSDGYLDVTVTSLLGDFYLGDSRLSVTTTDVAEPGIVSLLGLGVAGLLLSRRRV